MDYNPLMPSENKEEEIERKIENENPFFIPSKSNQNKLTIYGEKSTLYLLIAFIFLFFFNRYFSNYRRQFLQRQSRKIFFQL